MKQVFLIRAKCPDMFLDKITVMQEGLHSAELYFQQYKLTLCFYLYFGCQHLKT